MFHCLFFKQLSKKAKKKRIAEVEEQFQKYLTDAITYYQSRVQWYQTRYGVRLTVAEFLKFNASVSGWGSCTSTEFRYFYLYFFLSKISSKSPQKKEREREKKKGKEIKCLSNID
jgi:hypothetical protein